MRSRPAQNAAGFDFPVLFSPRPKVLPTILGIPSPPTRLALGLPHDGLRFWVQRSVRFGTVGVCQLRTLSQRCPKLLEWEDAEFLIREKCIA